MAKKKKKADPDALPDPMATAPTPTAPAPQLDYEMPDGNQELGNQVIQAWQQLLALATSQGATRRDIVLMTLATAHGIVKITGENLWPRGEELPGGELYGFGVYQAAYHVTGQAMEALSTPTGEERE